jgi:hypothetical protein
VSDRRTPIEVDVTKLQPGDYLVHRYPDGSLAFRARVKEIRYSPPFTVTCGPMEDMRATKEAS